MASTTRIGMPSIVARVAARRARAITCSRDSHSRASSAGSCWSHARGMRVQGVSPQRTGEPVSGRLSVAECDCAHAPAVRAVDVVEASRSFTVRAGNGEDGLVEKFQMRGGVHLLNRSVPRRSGCLPQKSAVLRDRAWHGRSYGRRSRTQERADRVGLRLPRWSALECVGKKSGLRPDASFSDAAHLSAREGGAPSLVRVNQSSEPPLGKRSSGCQCGRGPGRTWAARREGTISML